MVTHLSSRASGQSSMPLMISASISTFCTIETVMVIVLPSRDLFGFTLMSQVLFQVMCSLSSSSTVCGQSNSPKNLLLTRRNTIWGLKTLETKSISVESHQTKTRSVWPQGTTKIAQVRSGSRLLTVLREETAILSKKHQVKDPETFVSTTTLTAIKTMRNVLKLSNRFHNLNVFKRRHNKRITWFRNAGAILGHVGYEGLSAWSDSLKSSMLIAPDS
jgi:hypothetical protein